MEQIICTAIAQRKVIKFFYDGGERVVEPFCYGRNSKGNDVLRAFQIGGASSSGEPFGWKLYIVNDMDFISISANTFNSIRPHYNPNDKGMVEIYCAV